MKALMNSVFLMLLCSRAHVFLSTPRLPVPLQDRLGPDSTLPSTPYNPLLRVVALALLKNLLRLGENILNLGGVALGNVPGHAVADLVADGLGEGAAGGAQGANLLARQAALLGLLDGVDLFLDGFEELLGRLVHFLDGLEELQGAGEADGVRVVDDVLAGLDVGGDGVGGVDDGLDGAFEGLGLGVELGDGAGDVVEALGEVVGAIAGEDDRVGAREGEEGEGGELHGCFLVVVGGFCVRGGKGGGIWGWCCWS